MTKPIAQLVTGNFLDLVRGMPARSVDHTITDPPYLEHTHASQRSGAKGKAVSRARSLDFASITPAERSVYAEAIARVTRRWAIVFTDWEGWDGWRVDLIAAGMAYVRQLVWVRGTVDVREGTAAVRGRKGAPQFSGDRPAAGHETMILAHAAKPGQRAADLAEGKAGLRMRWNGRGADRAGRGGLTGGGTVYTSDLVTPDVRLHPAQKPLVLMRELVREFTDAGETIFDPFAGAATTLIAAVLEGRGARGCEVMPSHAATSRARLAQTQAARA